MMSHVFCHSCNHSVRHHDTDECVKCGETRCIDCMVEVGPFRYCGSCAPTAQAEKLREDLAAELTRLSELLSRRATEVEDSGADFDATEFLRFAWGDFAGEWGKVERRFGITAQEQIGRAGQ